MDSGCCKYLEIREHICNITSRNVLSLKVHYQKCQRSFFKRALADSKLFFASASEFEDIKIMV